MKTLIISLITAAAIFANEDVRVDKTDITPLFGNDYRYSIQLITFGENELAKAKKFFNNLIDPIKSQSVIYPINKYITIRYSTSIGKSLLKKDLKKMKDIGFKDAFIVLSNSKIFNHNKNESSDSELKKELTKKKKVPIKNNEKIEHTKNEKKTILKKENVPKINDKLIKTIQLYTSANLDDAKKRFDKIPKNIQNKTTLYPVSRYVTARYLDDSLPFSLKKIIKLGYKDAFIVNTSLERFNKYSKNKVEKDPIIKINLLSSYDYNRIIKEAHNSKVENDLHRSVELYEKAFLHTQNNQSINSNLYYLYGMTNNWEKAKKYLSMIESNSNKDKSLYSYSLGALAINNETLEKDLLPFLNLDISGYTRLVIASHFEKKEDISKSFDYYEKAYNMNKYDTYVTFAYARANELIEDYEKSIYFYKLLFERNVRDNLHLQDKAFTRYKELEKLTNVTGEK